MTLIKITRSPYSKGVNLEVNGQRVRVPAEGETANIAAEFLPTLDNSHINYEIVGAADEAGAGAAGAESDAPAEAEKADEPEQPAETDEERAAREAREAEEAAEAERLAAEQAEADAALAAATDLTLLDGSVPKIVPRLAELPDAQVKALLAAERSGKTRSTLIAAMEERLNPPAQE